MKNSREQRVPHMGRIGQTRVYFAKFLRMFVYQNDWKVLPMAAIISAVVIFVVGTNMFVTQEGTVTGTFALVCVCIWIGFFNSIQIVCRERDIIKREHRAGLHITSYVMANMLFQLLLCAAQTAIILLICQVAKVQIPTEGVIFQSGIMDLSVTIFLTIYASDMMALMVSCFVRNTTTAMTVMPFLLIFQLVFSGGYFDLSGFTQRFIGLTISHWGMVGLCAIGQYNTRPMVTLWNTIFKFRNIEYMGQKPLLDLIKKTEQEGKVEDFLRWSATYNQNEAYASSTANVFQTWSMLLLQTLVYVIIAIIVLERIDQDKR